MTRHTPGPWVVEHVYDGSRTVAEMRSQHLVCVNTTEHRAPAPCEAVAANARLVAAAPDLLVALRELHLQARDFLLEFGGPLPPVPRLRNAIADAWVAIEEAEGRT